MRSAAVSAVESALRAPSAGGAASGAIASLPSKRRPKPKASAPATAAAVLASKPRKGTRVRRTAEQIQATANKIHAFVKANPNTNAEGIKKALAIVKNEWLAPLSLLMDARRLSSRGQKRATTYTAR